RDRLLLRLRRRAGVRRGDRGERLVRQSGCDAGSRAHPGLPRRLPRAPAARAAGDRALAGDAAARGAAHLAGSPGLQPLPARLPHDDRQGPRVLAPPPGAPHRQRAPALMDASIRVTEVPARRGVHWLVEAFTLFRQKPMAWIGLCAGWLVVTFGLLLLPLIGGVIANFLQPVFFASFAVVALRQLHGEKILMGDLFLG